MTASSPRRSPSQQRARDTVEALVEAAAQVFERHGYAAGTTNRIAERAGVSIGTLYQYFADKDELLIAVAERHVTEAADSLAPLLEQLRDADPPPAPEPLLRAFVTAMVAEHAERPRLHRLLYAEAALPEALLARVLELERAIADELAAYLRRRGRAGADPQLTAWLVVQAVESATHRWAIAPPRERTPAADAAFAAETARLLAAGIG